MPKSRHEAGLEPRPLPTCSFCGSDQKAVALMISSALDEPVILALTEHLQRAERQYSELCEQEEEHSSALVDLCVEAREIMERINVVRRLHQELNQEIEGDLLSPLAVPLKARVCCNCGLAAVQQTFIHTAVIKEELRGRAQRQPVAGADGKPAR